MAYRGTTSLSPGTIRGMKVVPQMTFGMKGVPVAEGAVSADTRQVIRDVQWNTLQVVSRTMYRWLTGKEADQKASYVGTYRRLNVGLPVSNGQYLLPRQEDVRRIAPKGAPHLRDSVHISEDRQALRSSVVASKEAYWAYFVEFGTTRQVAQPRWVPAAAASRTLYYRMAQAELQAALKDPEAVRNIMMSLFPQGMFTRRQPRGENIRDRNGVIASPGWNAWRDR